MFLSANADFFSLKLYKVQFYFSDKVAEGALKFVTSICQHFLSRLFFIIFSNASAVVVAYFDFKGFTRR